MSEGKVYVDDTPQLRVDTGIDLTDIDTSSAILKILKPNGVKVNKTATVTTTPNDGILIYQCVAGDLPVEGIYKVQAHVTFLIGVKSFTGETAQFKVYNAWG